MTNTKNFYIGQDLIAICGNEVFRGKFDKWYEHPSGTKVPVLSIDFNTQKIVMGVILPYHDETWALLQRMTPAQAWDWASAISLCIHERVEQYKGKENS